MISSDQGDTQTAAVSTAATRCTLVGSAKPLSERHDVILTDLDGVAFMGTDPIHNAKTGIETARRAGAHFVFLTNNASRSPRAVVDHLATVGIAAVPSDIYTSSMAAASMVAVDFPAGSPILAVGDCGLLEALTEVGLVPVSHDHEQPVAVIQGFGPKVGWTMLAEATYAIGRGVPYYVTNLDATLPTERGFAPGNGALVAAVTKATGVEPRSAGKPEAGIFTTAAARAKAKFPLVVGDRLETDLAGARNAGYPGLFVLTGVSQVIDLLCALPPNRPSYVGCDLMALNQPHPQPQRYGRSWVCGESRAQLDGTELRFEGSSVDPIDRLRCAAAIAWDQADTIKPLARDDLMAWLPLIENECQT